MIDLVFEDYHPNYKRCGCYIRSEEFVKLYPKKHVLAPLRSCAYQVDLVNSIASVTLVQTYQNPTEKFLQLEYNVPINPNACVYKFTADFGKMRIQGIVKEKEQARKEYQEAVKEGKRAALGEINNESKDIMTLKVGNVGPAEYVKIQIAYLQELGLSNNTFYQFHLPGTISPRYMNHVPNEALVKGARQPGQLSAEGTFTWSFKINLKTTRKVVLATSSSHAIIPISQNDTKTLSQFGLVEAQVPNKDFNFIYTTEEFQLPSYVYGSTDVSSSAMLSFIPKFCSLDLDDAYKASVMGTVFEADIETAKGEYVFLLDRSGSMGGKRIEKAKEALILFIKSLPQDTYFNVVSFGSASSKLFPNSVKYNDKEVKKAVEEIKKMSADMGGTEIYNPLKTLLQSKPIAEGYPKQVFLLTDGGVSNTEGVIRMVGQNNKYARVHTIAVGNGASEALILGCAKSGKGYHVFINDDENPSEKIIQLLTDSLSPVISNIKLKYDKNVVQSIIPNPESLPYILKGELVNFYINFKGQLQEPTVMSFSYEDSVTKLPYTAEIHVQPEPNSLPFVDKMGHFKKIRLMEQSFTNNSQLEDYMFYVKVVDKKAEIVKESVRHQILSEFTAFICVQQELIDGKYSEIKNTGQISVLVENPIPVQYEEVVYEKLVKRKMDTATLSMNRSKKMAMPSVAMCSAPRGVDRGMAPMAPMAPQIQQQMASIRSEPQRQMLMKCAMPKAEKKSSGIGSLFGNITSSIASVFSSSSAKQSEMKEQKKQRRMPVYDAPDPFSGPTQQGDYAVEEKSIKKKMKQKEQVIVVKECYDMKDQEDQDLGMCMEMDIEIPQSEKKKEVMKEKKSESTKISSFTIQAIIGLQSTEGSWKDLSLLASLYSPEVKERVASGEHVIAVLTYLVAKWIEKHHPQKQYSLLIKKALNFVKKEIPNHEEFLKVYQPVLP